MTTEKKLSHQHYLKLHNHPALLPASSELVYVNDKSNGIYRIKKGNQFQYIYNHRTVTAKKVLQRIQQLAIPPAWDKVWICDNANGHLQATGYDAKMRKQYRYHALWNNMRTETKFHHLLEFGKALPKIRTQIEKDIAQKTLSDTKVIATVIALMEKTYIRIGNECYEKMNQSYGLTTLKDKHVTITGETIAFTFKGKKGIHHHINLQNKRLAKIVKDCKDIPGKELFQYYTATGQHKSIDSSMVNNYIKAITGKYFTAKDFRTWAGSLHMLRALATMEKPTSENEKKRHITAALETVSCKLGNTKTVCRKYYVHPAIITMYVNDTLQQYLPATAKNAAVSNTLYNAEEAALMKLLKVASTIVFT